MCPPSDQGPPSRPVFAELGIRVDDLDEAMLDTYPFGIIQLDNRGRVLRYNAYEESLARMRREDVLGKNFFFQVAPCTRVRAFYGRFLDGVAAKALEARFGFVFAFEHGDREVQVTMAYRASDDTVWVLVQG